MKLDFAKAHEMAKARAAVRDDVDDIFLSAPQRAAKARLQAYADEYAATLLRDEKLTAPVVCVIDDTKRGWANYEKRTVTLPMWLITREWRFQQAYVIHELAHHVMHDDDEDFDDGHGPFFQRCEADLMFHELRLRPLYNARRGYAIAYMDVDTHVLVSDGEGYGPNHVKFSL